MALRISVLLRSTYNDQLDKMGIVRLYTDQWYNMCDTGVDDVTASILCESLGYYDGLALCCSALDTLWTSEKIHMVCLTA